MTESEWRASHAEPGELRRRADELTSRGQRLTEEFSVLVRASNAAGWRGTAADRFFGDVGDWRSRVERARNAIESAANTMRNEAHRLEEELERAKREDRDRAAKKK